MNAHFHLFCEKKKTFTHTVMSWAAHIKSHMLVTLETVPEQKFPVHSLNSAFAVMLLRKMSVVFFFIIGNCSFRFFPLKQWLHMPFSPEYSSKILLPAVVVHCSLCGVIFRVCMAGNYCYSLPIVWCALVCFGHSLPHWSFHLVLVYVCVTGCERTCAGFVKHFPLPRTTTECVLTFVQSSMY